MRQYCLRDGDWRYRESINAVESLFFDAVQETYVKQLEEEYVCNIYMSKNKIVNNQDALQATYLELFQHVKEKQTWHPVHLKDIPEESRKQILNSYVLYKQKYKSDGTLDKYKCRVVGGGERQDRTIYDDVSSPTGSTISLFTLFAIAAYEKRHVATCDIGGAYLNAKMTGIPV